MGRSPATPAALLVCLVGVVGCQKDLPERPPWAPQPSRGTSDRSCDDIAKTPGVTESKLAKLRLDGDHLAVADPSVLGGPFAPHVSIAIPKGDHVVRAILGKTRLGDAKPLCARLTVDGRGAPVKFETRGAVAIDTEALVFADEKRWIPGARALGASMVGMLEGEADAFDLVLPELAAKGLEFDRVLPTLARAKRGATPGDRALATSLLRDRGAKLHYAEEPASGGWVALNALSDESIAPLDLPEAKHVGVAVDAGEGDGTYSVRVGLDATGAVAVVDVLLSP